MTVKEAVALLQYGTDYEVRGAYSGKVYRRSTNSSKNFDKYADREVTDSPFSIGLKLNKFDGIGEWCKPIVQIWMHDYDIVKGKG